MTRWRTGIRRSTTAIPYCCSRRLQAADMMQLTEKVIRPDELRSRLTDPGAGAYASFEGWIRNQNEGQAVLRLEYESYEPLAVKEGERVIEEAAVKFPILKAECVHRVGMLEIGECAVWVGVSSPHRDEAF